MPAMTRGQFEEFLKHITNRMKAEEASCNFSKGYAFGKLLTQTTSHMSESEKAEFQDGFDHGVDIEVRKIRVH
jgi:hypothetical protein